MKNLILLALVFAGTIAQAAESKDFQCVNNMYREARFEIVGDRLLIQDTAIRQADGLREALKDLIGLKGELSLNKVALEVSEASKICSSSALKLLVDCNGAAEWADLHIEGMVFTKKSGTVHISLSLPVKTAQLKLNSHITSNGPVSLDGSTTTVELNELQLNATAEVLINEKPVSLAWDTFFYTQDKAQNSSSFCKK